MQKTPLLVLVAATLAALLCVCSSAVHLVDATAWEPCIVDGTSIAGNCVPSTLIDGDSIAVVSWILSPVAPGPFTVTLSEPTGRITFSPSTINVAGGAVAFEAALAAKFLNSDSRRNYRLPIWLKFDASGNADGYIGGARMWIHNVTLQPNVYCELRTPTETFYPGSTSTALNLTCNRATDSAVTFLLPDLSASNGITFSPAALTLNPGDVYAEFTATASSNATLSVGTYPLNLTATGANATRYSVPPVRSLRVMPAGRVAPPPAFTTVAWRETDPLRLDLTIVPARPINVTIRVFRYNESGNGGIVDSAALDEVEILPSATIMYNSHTAFSAAAANRGNFTLLGKRYGDYWLTFQLAGSERSHFADPFNATTVNVTITSPEDGFAFTKRSSVGFLSNFRRCRIGVGRKSFYRPMQERVDEPICDQLTRPNFTSADFEPNCSRWLSPQRCQWVTQHWGHPCAWVRSPVARCIDVPEVMNATVQVAFGISSTTFLDVNGTVWTVGAPVHGQLGRGYLQQEEQENVPGVVTLPEAIKSIAMGANHVLALGVSGVLYGWGANSLGQLGQGSVEPTYVFPQVINFARYENVSCISAGAQHSAVVTLGGRFYVFGSNAQGQMGRNPDAGNGGVTNLTKPTEIPRSVFKGDNLVALQCGETHTSVATDTAVYTFGGDMWGQLGRDFRFHYALRATSAASSLALSTEEATQSQLISNWKPNSRPMDLYARIRPVVPPFPFNNSANDTFTPTYAPYQIVTAPPYPSVRRGRDCT